MKSCNRLISYSFLIILITLIMPFVIPSYAFSYDLPGWYHGAAGYEDAMSISKNKETPIILFFYIESNELCQKLRDNYLRNYEVYSFLDDFLNVAVDLDGNDFDKDLAKRYNTEGEPALMVKFPFSEAEPFKVTPFQEEGEISPEEFVNNLKNIFSLAYSDKGFQLFTDDEYSNAIKYFKISIKHSPKRAYPVFAMGSVYHAMAIEEKRQEYLDMAEENYNKALKLDPKCKECKEELEKLQENKGKISWE